MDLNKEQRRRRMPQTTVALDRETFERLQQMAEAAKSTLSETIRTVVEWGLESHDAHIDHPPG